MRKFAVGVLAVLAALSASACSHSASKLESGQNAVGTEAGIKGIVMEVLWVKHKRTSIDLNVHIHNGYDRAVVFNRQAWSMKYNDQAAGPNNNHFPERFEPGFDGTHVMAFKFTKDVDPKGHGTVTIDPIMREAAEGKQERIAPIQFAFELK